MRDLAILLIHVLVTIARLMCPGGARSVVVESLLVKRQLERKLVSFQDYYNKDGVHRRLDGATPNEQSEIMDRKTARLEDYRGEKMLRGLYQGQVAA